MAYQVLARKWRPRLFREMVGQEHVLRALINALDQNRLHHAYLFTGTRGVGKTTIARILAKCFNCETGVSSEPCGQCSSCVEIAEGRFIDLQEIDAASRTKVEDTRELLENVQYAPSRGRYKVYLIDEVHMLSNSSFNALLKTLEEPPEHVKFLFATTDPKKLPATVLSRCLQFNLKNMTPERIVGHLQTVLGAEMVGYDDAALWLLARAADGSMRDALSLTDQALAFTGEKITEKETADMLGSIDKSFTFSSVDALIAKDGDKLMSLVEELSDFAPDYDAFLAQLLSLLHRIALAQAVPDAVENSSGDKEQVLALAKQLTGEDVQLYYQIGLMGRRDLDLAPDHRSGVEMSLLRMLAFTPNAPTGEKKTLKIPSSDTAPSLPSDTSPEAKAAAPIVKTDNVVAIKSRQPPPAPVAQPQAASVANNAAVQTKAVKSPELAANSAPRTVSPPQAVTAVKPSIPAPDIKPLVSISELPAQLQNNQDWLDLFPHLAIGGVTKSIAANSQLSAVQDATLLFHIGSAQSGLLNDTHQQRIAQAIETTLQLGMKVHFEVVEPQADTPAILAERKRVQRQELAQQSIMQDENIQRLQSVFGAVIVQGSIVPVDENS